MRQTVLIVEDEPAILELVRGILVEAETFEVRCAKTAEVGLRIALNLDEPVDLLIVEDEPAILELVRGILVEAETFEVRCAKTAEVGLRIALNLDEPVDLL